MTRRTYKIIRNSFILFIALIVITFLSIRIWLGNRFESVVEGLNYAELTENIKHSNELPEELYQAFSKVHNYDQNTTTSTLILKTPLRLIGLDVKSADCACVEVNYRFTTSFWDRLTVGLQLDKDVGTKSCMDYYLNHFDFLNGNVGVKKASEYYFNKPLESLDENEFIELCIMTKNPSYYNKKTNPEKLKLELLKIIN